MGIFDAYLAELDEFPAGSGDDRAALIRQLEIANGHLADMARAARLIRLAILILGGLNVLIFLGPLAIRVLGTALSAFL